MIGKFSKRVLLTGAGWSRNWGGQLASEVWSSLAGHAVVQKNERLRQLLLREPSFEVALSLCRHPPFITQDRLELEAAVLDTFVRMDHEIGRPDHDPRINIYKVQEFLFRFWGQRNDANTAGFWFTLNQDLFPERHLYNEHVAGAPRGALPGLVARHGQNSFTSLVGRYDDEFVMRPIADPARQGRLHGQMNVIKLHGSFNWRSADGDNLLVIGTDKTAKIAATPLLAWYADIFRQVLFAGDVRLMIVGYGFADEHINAVIAEAVTNHRLSVFVWNTAPDLKQQVLAAPHGATIWGGLISTAARSLVEVFPGNQSVTEEYRRICDSFFS
jgi:SIR2-like domain